METETEPEKPVASDVVAEAQSFIEDIAGKMAGDSVGDSEIAPEEPPGQSPEQETAVPESEPSDVPSKPGTDQRDHGQNKSDDGLDPKVQERIDRRIAKEVAKAKAAIEESADLREQLNALKARIESEPSKPMVDVEKAQTPKDLESIQAQAEQVVDHVEALLDRIDDAPDTVESELKRLKAVSRNSVGAEDWSAESMKRTLKEIRRNATRTLKDVPKRVAFLETQSNAEQRALELVPELADGASERFKRFDATLRHVPQLKSNPNWPLLAALIVLGSEKRAAGTQTASTQPIKPKPPASPAAGSAAATKPRADARGDVDPDTRRRALFGNDQDARTAIIEQMLG